MSDLDPIIHQPVRLRIVSALAGLEGDAEVDFTFLRDTLGLTDGNLGAHLRKLEAASYVRIHKRFAGRKPQTLVHLTAAGRRAFDRHVAALRAIIGLED